MYRFIAAAAAAFALCAAPAFAAERAFTAHLDGITAPTITESAATGDARIAVDTEAQTVDVALTVHGLTLDDLFDHVIHSGMGPVHLHLYAANGDISLLVPFPYGSAYAPTADGFTLTVNDYSYAEGAAVLRSEVTFEQFLASLGSDFVYLNIHTDRVNDGEISGRLTPAS
jgi:hypothetical protein